ncbi:MAG: hypothetical protein QOE90_2056 [Thermoplasmata archaeon]|jgi:hypothetical protein|nr:hypothetical protein [Thermoplasmata archaeon]
MIATRLLVTAGVNAIAIVVASVVAMRLVARPTHGASRRATLMFALWWAGFAADTLLNTLTWLAGGAGVASELVTDLLSYPALTCIVLMIWGLVYYLVYLFTGRDDLFVPIAAFYALSWLAFLVLVVSLRPVGVHMGPYQGAIAYAREPPAAAELWVAIFFLLPPIVGALLYGSLAPRIRDRAHRYRVIAVSIGIFVWFTASLVLTGVGANGDALAIFGKALGLACLGLILSAYVQPAWSAKRFPQRVAALDPAARPPPDPDALTAREQRRRSLQQRVRELV